MGDEGSQDKLSFTGVYPTTIYYAPSTIYSWRFLKSKTRSMQLREDPTVAHLAPSLAIESNSKSFPRFSNICIFSAENEGLGLEGIASALRDIPVDWLVLFASCAHTSTGLHPNRKQWKPNVLVMCKPLFCANHRSFTPLPLLRLMNTWAKVSFPVSHHYPSSLLTREPTHFWELICD